MDFRNQLVSNIQRLGKASVLKKLGYTKPTIKHTNRLDNVISSPYLGLNTSYYDFKYSKTDYIKKLTEICGLNIELANNYIFETLSELDAKDKAFKPYIFVETGFKRTTQPIFVLSALESHRYIRLPESFSEYPLLDQLVHLHNVIDEHMKETKGTLLIWGNIHSYFFVYDAGCALEISPCGKFIKNHYDFEPSSRASLSIRGKELKLG